jgi:uncharacterized membrane protein (DUF4010 family)
MAKLRGLLGLIVAMIGWVLVIKGLTVAIWLGVVVAVVLVALWLWWLRVKRDRDSDWVSAILIVVTWACWGIAAWVGLLLAVWMGAFAGAALGLWELNFGDR